LKVFSASSCFFGRKEVYSECCGGAGGYNEIQQWHRISARKIRIIKITARVASGLAPDIKWIIGKNQSECYNST
jgi:hypothetical protein